MRILHVTDHYLPVLGGIESHVSELAARQTAQGDEVTVLTCAPATADGQHSDDRHPVHVRRVRPGGRFPRDLDLAGFDVCHAHLSVAARFTSPVAALARRRGLPTVVTVHSLWNGLGPVPGLLAAVARLRGAPVLWTAVSHVAAEQLASQLPRRARVHVVPNAVDVDPRTATPVRREGEPVRLVSTMRIARRKRPLPLLRLFGQLQRSTDRQVSLTVIGDGPQRGRLQRHIRGTSLEGSVRVTGRLTIADVLSEVSGADLYVAPALLESFGLAALEARSLGLPVVGLAGSGLREFVSDAREGWLCASDRSLVTMLRRLVEDDDLRHRIAEHNRTTPADFTWSHALMRNEATYSLAAALVASPRTTASLAKVAG